MADRRSFAVIFAQRQVDGRWERRLEAEQTEVEPAPEPRKWANWDCGPLCDWMLGQLGLAADEADEAGVADRAAVTVEPAAVEPAAAEPAAVEPAEHAAAGGGAPERARLRIDSVTITDAAHDVDLINAGISSRHSPAICVLRSACASPCTAGAPDSSCGRPYGSVARMGRGGARKTR